MTGKFLRGWMGVVLLACAGWANANLLTNPGFEIQGAGGVSDPAGWSRTSASVVQRHQEAGQAGHGDWMLLISDNAHAWHWASQAVPASPGTEYFASAQLKGVMQTGEIAYIYMGWLDANGSEIGNAFSTYTSGDGDYADWAWVTRSVTAVAPSGTAQVSVRVMGYMDGQGNSALFADNTLLKAVGAADPARIVDGELVSSNLVKLVVEPHGTPNSYYPKFRERLEDGAWAGVAHSNNGENPFVVTNLDYSSTDASGTNRVVYVRADTRTGFFRIGKVAGLFKKVKTMFQTNEFYDPREALAVDGVIIHRHGVGFPDLFSHIASWEGSARKLGRMFFADSDAGNAYTSGAWDGTEHSDDIEADQSGELLVGDRPYMVPTTGWTQYEREQAGMALVSGAAAIFPEEPLAHAFAGYSPSFKQLWVQHYGSAWEGQHTSALARYKTARLKSKLYLDLEASLMEATHTNQEAVVADPLFVIPIHSIYGNVAAQLVAPLGESTGIDGVDGYIGQIWTGPINWALGAYNSSEKSFSSSAYALYDYFTQITVGTDKKLWLLVDPVEDDPNHTWADYAEWYHHSVSAMLLMPSVDSYEVMPWPERIFLPGFSTGGSSDPAPEDFRKTALAITQVLQEVPLGGQWSMMGSDSTTPGIGVAIADSVMWLEDRAYKLQGTYGQLLPLIERGVPVGACVLERSADAAYMDRFRVIVVGYEDFKPMTEAMNTALVDWVRRGGVLVMLGDSSDALDASSYFWWKQLGYANPMDHLLAQLGGTGPGEWSFGNGYVIRNETSPSAFANPSTAESVYLPLIDKAVQHTASGGNLSTPGYLMMRRGPFIVAHAWKRAVSKAGKFVDIYDPALPVLDGISMEVGESGLYRDVTQAMGGGQPPSVLHATHRLVSQQFADGGLRFSVRGPEDTPAVARIFLAGQNVMGTTATNSAGQAVAVANTVEGNTLWLEFPNDPNGTEVAVRLAERTLPPVVTTATVSPLTASAVEGSNGDAFDGATITDHTPLLVVNMNEDPADWFRSPNAGETLFSDPPGTKFIEFNAAGLLTLTNIIVYVSADPSSSDPGDEERSVSNVKLYASETASPVWSAGNLVFDIPLNPDYTLEYGSQYIAVSVDLSAVQGQYFRLEVEQPHHGARIREVDAY